MRPHSRLEQLLSFRTHLCPELHNDKIFFVSNLSGFYGLYAMPFEGGFPQPLLPTDISLHDPTMMYGSKLFSSVPNINKIIIMLDDNGNENYQPYLIPVGGGIPEKLFAEDEAANKYLLTNLDKDLSIAYFIKENTFSKNREIFQVNLKTMKSETIAANPYVAIGVAYNKKHETVIFSEHFVDDDDSIYLWTSKQKKSIKITDQKACYNNLSFTSKNLILCKTSLFHDTYSPALIDPHKKTFREVTFRGLSHVGIGELNKISHISENIYFIEYNINGSSHGYIGTLDESKAQIKIKQKLCGVKNLASGVLHSFTFRPISKESYEGILSFSTATTPPQLLKVRSSKKSQIISLTNEHLLGIEQNHLSQGEDASFESFDGLTISARLYLPSKQLGFKGPRPLILYIHGGPQSQERPDFSWFSMPLIQYFTLNGFAVFVPNVRGSTGYGINYTKMIFKNWGGDDLKDHVYGLKSLEKDKRLDSRKRGSMGRSYGGFMTMCLLTKYPELLNAGADVFGMCDLIGFREGLPKPLEEYCRTNIGDPEVPSEKTALIENSPITHFDKIKKPILFIQGTNDPRAQPHLMKKYLEILKEKGKNVEYLDFPDEGHGFTKRTNIITCYHALVDFFKKHLEIS